MTQRHELSGPAQTHHVALLCRLMQSVLRNMHESTGIDVSPLYEIGCQGIAAYCRDNDIDASAYQTALREISALIGADQPHHH